MCGAGGGAREARGDESTPLYGRVTGLGGESAERQRGNRKRRETERKQEAGGREARPRAHGTWRAVAGRGHAHDTVGDRGVASAVWCLQSGPTARYSKWKVLESRVDAAAPSRPNSRPAPCSLRLVAPTVRGRGPSDSALAALPRATSQTPEAPSLARTSVSHENLFGCCLSVVCLSGLSLSLYALTTRGRVRRTRCARTTRPPSPPLEAPGPSSTAPPRPPAPLPRRRSRRARRPPAVGSGRRAAGAGVAACSSRNVPAAVCPPRKRKSRSYLHATR